MRIVKVENCSFATLGGFSHFILFSHWLDEPLNDIASGSIRSTNKKLTFSKNRAIKLTIDKGYLKVVVKIDTFFAYFGRAIFDNVQTSRQQISVFIQSRRWHGYIGVVFVEKSCDWAKVEFRSWCYVIQMWNKFAAFAQNKPNALQSTDDKSISRHFCLCICSKNVKVTKLNKIREWEEMRL